MKPINDYFEFLQVNCSDDTFPYSGIIKVTYKDYNEVLENMDQEIDNLYPIFCDLLKNVENMKSNSIFKAKFKDAILISIKYIMDPNNLVDETYIYSYFGSEYIESPGDEPWPHNTILFDLYDDEEFKWAYEGEHSLIRIRDYMLDNQYLHLWAQLLNKLVSIKGVSTKITSLKYRWKNLGQIDESYGGPNLIIVNDNSIESYLRYFIDETDAKTLTEIGSLFKKHILGFYEEDKYCWDLLDAPSHTPFFVHEDKYVTELFIYHHKFNQLPLIIGKFEKLKELYINCPIFEDIKGEQEDEGKLQAEYVKKKYNYSIRSFESLKIKIQNHQELDLYDLSLPDLDDFRQKLIEECDRFHSEINLENTNKLKKYFYQGFLLKKPHYKILRKLKKKLQKEIIAADIDDFFYKASLGVVIKNELIEILYLKGQGLTEIPDDIGDLKGTKELFLSNNNLSSLPKSFAKLTSLEYLKLKSNKFTSYPVEIGNLQKLTEVEHIFIENPIENPIDIEDEYCFLTFLQQKYLIREWSISNLLNKIKSNQELDDADFLHPKLFEFEDKIVETCQKYKENKSSKEMLEILNERKALLDLYKLIGEEIPLIIPYSYESGYSVLDHQVFSLDLTGKNLDHLPESFKNLNHLRSFHIYRNNFIDFPLEIISTMKYLEEEPSLEENPWSAESLEYINALKEDRLEKFYEARMNNWNLENLLFKIKNNEKLSILDKKHPDLCKFISHILEECVKFKTETAKKMMEILEERCMIKIGKENYKIWK